ncbi:MULTISPECIES: HAD-IIIA family hydrolase [unclassified Emticicia]|uniref:D-glycero-alpha-D-manno-heptose-1,7-bisphosphate 7-phosphatase n=1 Tax=unclassified Emticicia TaxID=2627301 RepID=UPI000C789088|nr:MULTISPECIES: HAD family hydrolase [unclassified Emticicia]PLK45618.1 D,D-heptose 1,7-bisphosphate phosphatase [Emticicia sp. TH156]UTA69413.1 HAD family hydrolase [Emticicia sp. 21SJ11W-3]
MQKCIFLDRDGVLNEDKVDYVYKLEDYIIPEGVVDGLNLLKNAGYLLIVITNQAGIAKGLYSREDVMNCYDFLQSQCGGVIDDIYFCAHHPQYTSESLLRKPDSLMLEKAMAKYNIDAAHSYMIGDAERDVKAGIKAGVKTIHIATGKENTQLADYSFSNLLEASKFITENPA